VQGDRARRAPAFPLPPENTAELVTFVLVLADKPKVRGAVGASKKSDLPICPAA